jgi:hypothetical protein
MAAMIVANMEQLEISSMGLEKSQDSETTLPFPGNSRATFQIFVSFSKDEKERQRQAQDRARLLWLGEKVPAEVRTLFVLEVCQQKRSCSENHQMSKDIGR